MSVTGGKIEPAPHLVQRGEKKQPREVDLYKSRNGVEGVTELLPGISPGVLIVQWNIQYKVDLVCLSRFFFLFMYYL